jgi:hypothetical protein
MEKFSDWFDPYDIYHVRAFNHLCKTGYWPKGFIPDNLEMSSIWQYEVVAKLADAWTKHMIENEHHDI